MYDIVSIKTNGLMLEFLVWAWRVHFRKRPSQHFWLKAHLFSLLQYFTTLLQWNKLFWSILFFVFFLHNHAEKKGHTRIFSLEKKRGWGNKKKNSRRSLCKRHKGGAEQQDGASRSRNFQLAFSGAVLDRLHKHFRRIVYFTPVRQTLALHSFWTSELPMPVMSRPNSSRENIPTTFRPVPHVALAGPFTSF